MHPILPTAFCCLTCVIEECTAAGVSLRHWDPRPRLPPSSHGRRPATPEEITAQDLRKLACQEIGEGLIGPCLP